MWEESIKFSMIAVSYQTKIFPRVSGTFVEMNGINWKTANSLFDKCESTCFFLFVFICLTNNLPISPSPLLLSPPFLFLLLSSSLLFLPRKAGISWVSWALKLDRKPSHQLGPPSRPSALCPHKKKRGTFRPASISLRHTIDLVPLAIHRKG